MLFFGGQTHAWVTSALAGGLLGSPAGRSTSFLPPCLPTRVSIQGFNKLPQMAENREDVMETMPSRLCSDLCGGVLWASAARSGSGNDATDDGG